MLHRCLISFAIRYLGWNRDLVSLEVRDLLFTISRRITQQQVQVRKLRERIIKNVADNVADNDEKEDYYTNSSSVYTI